jgi:Zn-dependent alcohol dehydrogenase
LGKVGATFDVAINPLVQQEKRIIGSLYGSSNMPIEIPEILRLHKAGKLPLERLIGSRYELPQINEAYREMTQGAIGRAVITIDASATNHDLLSAPRLADISAAPARTSST